MNGKNKTGWRRYVQDYRFKSIFVKNLFMMLGVIVLPLVCLISICFMFIINTTQNEREIYSERIVTQIASDVDQMFAQNKEKIVMLGADRDIEIFFMQNKEQTKLLYDIQYLKKMMDILLNSTEYLDSIYVYSSRNQNVLSQSGARSMEAFHDIACLENIEVNEQQYQLKYDDRKILGGQRKRTLSLYRNVANGTIIVNMDVLKMKKHFHYGENVNFQIVKDDQILFSTDLSEIGNMLKDQYLRMQGDQIAKRSRLEEIDAEVITYIDFSESDSSISNVTLTMLCFVLIMCLLIVFISLYMSLKMSGPIEEILSVIEEIHIDTTNDGEKEDNEIGYIVKAIYDTINRNENFEQELKRRAILLKRAQSVALQAQINPHFINNTLESINWRAVAQLGEKNEVSEMVNHLSRIMRMALDRTNVFIRLEEEIYYAVLYLQIQNKRNENSFKVYWDIPQELLNCKVIKMILQPILENALKYGIFPYESTGEIRIEASRKQETLQICISDSGFGIPKEELEKIRLSIAQNVIRESNHIGLSNVNQRIRLAYGESYGISIFSELMEGTQVILSLPFLQN